MKTLFSTIAISLGVAILFSAMLTPVFGENQSKTTFLSVEGDAISYITPADDWVEGSDPKIRVDSFVVVDPETYRETRTVRTKILGMKLSEDRAKLKADFYIHARLDYRGKIESIAKEFRANLIEQGLIRKGAVGNVQLNEDQLLINGAAASNSDHRALWRKYSREYKDLNEIWLSVE
jgi:hypothetical protein